MTLLDFSQQIFGNKGNSYSPAQIAATETNGADVLYGTAQLDADSGEVEVLIDGTEIPLDPDDPDYGLASTMTCATEELIQAGDRVTVVRNGQNAKAIVLSPDSTGAAAAQQAADDAAKTATDYLTFDNSTGLTVGASSLSRAVNVNAGGVDILDGTDVLAHYGSYVGIGSGNGNDGILMVIDSPTAPTGYGASDWWAITSSVQPHDATSWDIYLDNSALIYDNQTELYEDVVTRIFVSGFYNEANELYLPPTIITIEPPSDHSFTRSAGIYIDSSGDAHWYDNIDAHSGYFSTAPVASKATPARLVVNGSVEFMSGDAVLTATSGGFVLRGKVGGRITSDKAMQLVDSDGITYLDQRAVIWDSGTQQWVEDPNHAADEISSLYLNADEVLVNGSPIGGGGSVKTATVTMSSDMTGLSSTQKRVLFNTTSDSSVATVSSGVVTVAEAGTYIVLGQVTVQGTNNQNRSYGMRLFSEVTSSGSGLTGTQLCYAGCYGYTNAWITMTGFGVATLAAGGTLGMTIACAQTDNSALTKGNTGTRMTILKVG